MLQIPFVFGREKASRLRSFTDFAVAISVGSHPFPSRTRKLSPPEPMVLHGKPCGRVGRCRIFFLPAGAFTRQRVFFWRTARQATRAAPVPCGRLRAFAPQGR